MACIVNKRKYQVQKETVGILDTANLFQRIYSYTLDTEYETCTGIGFACTAENPNANLKLAFYHENTFKVFSPATIQAWMFGTSVDANKAFFDCFFKAKGTKIYVHLTGDAEQIDASTDYFFTFRLENGAEKPVYIHDFQSESITILADQSTGKSGLIRLDQEMKEVVGFGTKVNATAASNRVSVGIQAGDGSTLLDELYYNWSNLSTNKVQPEKFFKVNFKAEGQRVQLTATRHYTPITSPLTIDTVFLLRKLFTE